jgi:predicted MFS family arabinose efflux permease
VSAAGVRRATAVPPVRRAGLWWHRDFRLLWIGQTTSRLGSSVTSLVLPLVAVATLGASTFQVALLDAAIWFPWLVIGLPAGAWVDRLPRQPVMVVCDLVSLLLFLSVPVAWWSGALTIGQLLTVALLAGTAAVFFQTAYQVYLPALLDRDRVVEGNARLQASEAAAQVTGPGLGGLIAQTFGAVLGLLADAASFLVSAVCLLSIRAREPRGAKEAEQTSVRREIAQGLRFVAADPYLRVFTVFGAASNLALIGYQSILVVFLVRVVGVRPGTVGILLAAASLGAVIGAAGATRVARRFGTARGLLLCELVCAPFGLLLPLTGPGPRLAFAVVGIGVVAVGVAVGNVIKGSFRQTYTPHQLLGRVTVSMQLLNYGTMPAGALIGGALATAIGIRTTMWVMMGGAVLATLTLLAGPIRRHRDLPDHPPGRRCLERQCPEVVR